VSIRGQNFKYLWLALSYLFDSPPAAASRLATVNDAHKHTATFFDLAKSLFVRQVVGAINGEQRMTTANTYDHLNRRPGIPRWRGTQSLTLACDRQLRLSRKPGDRRLAT